MKTAKRQEIAGRLEFAKSLGDLSENAEYQEAKEEQTLVEQRIAEYEERIREAVVMQKPVKMDTVAVGSTVLAVADKSAAGKPATGIREVAYTIVGSEEADPAAGKVSNESPLGKAFLGKKVGDKVEVRAPSGSITYTVVEIK